MPYLARPGANLWYQADGAGPALLFLHGRAGNGANWYRQIARFASTHRVLTMDHRGFGRSTCDGAAFSVPAMVDDVGAVLDACGVARVVIVCQSMSGIVGLRHSLAEPGRVAGLALCSTLGGITTADLRARLRAFEAANTVELPDRAFAPGYRMREPELFALYEQLFSFNGAFDPAWRGRLADPGVALAPEQLTAHTAPTLFVVGEHDLFFPPAMAHEVAALVPGATVVDFAGAGHSPYWEAPERFNSLLADWLAATVRW